VYLSRDSSDLGCKVAVKVMLACQARPGVRDGEAQAAGNLARENIVTIHDLAIDGDTPYSVTEYPEALASVHGLSTTISVRCEGRLRRSRGRRVMPPPSRRSVCYPPRPILR